MGISGTDAAVDITRLLTAMEGARLESSVLPVPTFGVEEEFFLVDAVTGQLCGRAPAVLAATSLGRGVTCNEIFSCQVESVSPVCRDATQLYRHLRAVRRALSDSARDHDAMLVASGTPISGPIASIPITEGTRYRRIASAFGSLIEGHAVCGCHVHVAMPDRERAVLVSDQLRQWLPTLLALTVNSPFHQQRDTGHDSWRTIAWSQLPSAGPPPYLGSLRGYERARQELMRSGAALDDRMVYWAIRPSEHLPTLEVRVGDTAATAEEALLFAVIVRALAAVALTDVALGRTPAMVGEQQLRLAMWQAAREGMRGTLWDPITGALIPARVRLEQLLEFAEPGLSARGELRLVETLLDHVLALGTGADRQRRAYARAGRWSDVVDYLARSTREGLAVVDGLFSDGDGGPSHQDQMVVREARATRPRTPHDT